MEIVNKITKDEMIEAISRSGYLLESEISNILSKAGFFVEPNQVIKDPITGKSREIDLTAEYFSFNRREPDLQAVCKIRYIFEIKNNLYPIVLMTKFEFTPNIESWLGVKEALTIPPEINYYWDENFYRPIIDERKENIYTQYCSFQKKRANDKLMALHPDNIHEGLRKITQFCEDEVKIHDADCIYPKEGKERKNHENKYFRHFIFLPVLLVNDELYEFHENKIKQVDSSILVFNYHYNQEPKIAYVFVVTKKGFPDFMNTMSQRQTQIEGKMIEIRKGNA